MTPRTISDYHALAEKSVYDALKAIAKITTETELTRDWLWNRINFAIGVLERKDGYPQYSMQQLADHLKQELERQRKREQQLLDELAVTNK